MRDICVDEMRITDDEMIILTALAVFVSFSEDDVALLNLHGSNTVDIYYS